HLTAPAGVVLNLLECARDGAIVCPDEAEVVAGERGERDGLRRSEGQIPAGASLPVGGRGTDELLAGARVSPFEDGLEVLLANLSSEAERRSRCAPPDA